MDKTNIKKLYEKIYKRKLVLNVNDPPLFNSFKKQFGDIFYSNLIKDTPFIIRIDKIIMKLQEKYDFKIVSPIYQIQLFAPNLIAVKITIDVDEKYLKEEGIVDKFGWFFTI